MVPIVSAAVAGSLGSAPAVALGGRLSAGVLWRSVSLEVEGRADAPATGSGSSGVQVKSWVDAVSLVPCLHVDNVTGCLVGSLGAVTATSLVASPQTNSALWVAFGPRVGIEVPATGALGLRVWAEALFLVDPAAFFVDGATQVYQLDSVEGSAGVGAVWRFL